MARYRNRASGVIVSVRDDKPMPEGRWESLDGTPSSGTGGYADRTVDDLKDEIRSRNEGRDDDARLPLTGTKAELVAALKADDE